MTVRRKWVDALAYQLSQPDVNPKDVKAKLEEVATP